MTTLYLAIGHGEEPDGTFDPGAVSGDLVEHTLARQVVEASARALTRSGFHDFIAETSGVDGHYDLDYRGSVIRANAAHAAVVCEVHFNAGSTSGHGTETLYYPTSEKGGHLASLVQQKLATAVGIDNRGVKPRSDLWLLRGTTGVAIIPEVAFVDGDRAAIHDHPRLCENAGEAIAAGILAYLGHRYVPPGAPLFYVTRLGNERVVECTTVDEALAHVKHLLSTNSVTCCVRKVTQ